MRIIPENGSRPVPGPSGISSGDGSVAGEDHPLKRLKYAAWPARATKVVESDSVPVNFLMLRYSISLNCSIRISR